MLLSTFCLCERVFTPYLVRTCDNSRELALLLSLTLRDCFNDGGVVGAEIDEDMSDASLQRCQHELVGVQRSKLTSQMASKKA